MGGFRGPIPQQLDWLKSNAEGRAWLEGLPRAVDDCARHWGLVLAEPFPYAFTSLAIPARLQDGSDAVLKVLHVDRENEHEAMALRTWDGEGSIRLLDEFSQCHALLLERCIPGTALSRAGADVALGVLIRLLPRLWKPAASPPFRTLSDEAAHWMETLEARPRTRLTEAALDALRVLPATQGAQVLLHQDLHGDNVLAAEREPWLVIDPKPLVGEREFGLAPIIRSSELGEGRREMLRRLDQLTGELGLDRERARLWCIAQTVAWSGDDLPTHAEIAQWLLEA